MVNIIIDTREQAPWSFDPGQAKTKVDTLKTGDYALEGDLNFAIERKSLDDFLATISSGWKRFLREIERMSDYPAKVVIVEGDFETVCFVEEEGNLHPPEHEHFELYPQFVIKQIALMSLMGVCILFAGNAEFASAIALQIFKERDEQIKKIKCQGRGSEIPAIGGAEKQLVQNPDRPRPGIG